MRRTIFLCYGSYSKDLTGINRTTYLHVQKSISQLEPSLALGNLSKMSLLELPEEVFIMIIKKLDSKSLYSLYSTCRYTRNVLQISNLVKEWHMTRSSIASAEYLKSDFFKDVARHLTLLNLCGVTDLCKTALLPALRRSKMLITLDVSYTDIDLIDFCDMYKACPTIKNLTINFNGINNFETKLIENYQDIFKNMDNIHFVGSCRSLLYSYIVVDLLKKSVLNIIKLTVALDQRGFGSPHCSKTVEYKKKIVSTFENVEHDRDLIKFDEFFVYLMNLEANFGNFHSINIFKKITTDNFEIIIIVNGEFLDKIEVFATPIFEDFFSNMFDINIRNIKQYILYSYYLVGNVGIMIFNKEFVNFDTVFFKKLYNRLEPYFPYVFSSDHQYPGPDKYDWFYAHQVVASGLSGLETPDQEPKSSCSANGFKKKRIGNPNCTLNYDTVFKNKHRAMLSLTFSENYVYPVTLSPNTEFLSKLTFLSLSGTVRYSVEFFNVLFRCCNRLVTLDVVAPLISPCFPPICRSIPLSQTLKNFRLVDRNIDFTTFFNSLSQCKTLENIHIYDKSSELKTLDNPFGLARVFTLFQNCEELYNISIKANMSDTAKRRMLRLFNDAKKACGKPQINVLICQNQLNTNDRLGLNYEPSLSVFNVFPIRPEHSFT